MYYAPQEVTAYSVLRFFFTVLRRSVSAGSWFYVGEDQAAIPDQSSVSGILLKELRSMPGKQPEDIDSSGRKVILGGNYVTEDI